MTPRERLKLMIDIGMAVNDEQLGEDSVRLKDKAAFRELDSILGATKNWLDTQGLANGSARLYDRLKQAGY